jgi:hypothetical protein
MIRKIPFLNGRYNINDKGDVTLASGTSPLEPSTDDSTGIEIVRPYDKGCCYRYRFSVAHLLAVAFRDQLGPLTGKIIQTTKQSGITLDDIQLIDAPDDWINEQRYVKQHITKNRPRNQSFDEFRMVYSTLRPHHHEFLRRIDLTRIKEKYNQKKTELEETQRRFNVQSGKIKFPKFYEYFISPEGYVVREDGKIAISPKSLNGISIKIAEVIAETYIFPFPKNAVLISLNPRFTKTSTTKSRNRVKPTKIAAIDIDNLMFIQEHLEIALRPPVYLRPRKTQIATHSITSVQSRK